MRYSARIASRARVERRSTHDIVWHLLVCFAFTKHPEFGDGVSPGNVEDFHALARLSVREGFIKFCRRESFKTFIHIVVYWDTTAYRTLNMESDFLPKPWYSPDRAQFS